jgi:predicted phage terminase large subunit-like protein
MVDSVEYGELLKAAGRQHFWAFCCYMDYEFFYVKRRFLKDVAMLFQKLYECYLRGEVINVSVSMPPRSGKSYITSMFCAWWLGVLPELSVMRNTCTGTLYDKLSYDTRAILTSEKYRSVFPDTTISQNKSNLAGWNTGKSRQVGYYGAGVGGTIIGFGANLAIVDDLYKSMADALSDNTNEKVKLWKQSAHDSRKERNCPEIFIGTRWSVNDVIGEAIETGKVLPENCVMIPALTAEGETFCDDVKTTKEYLQIRKEVEESVWMAEYMQQPYELKGLLFPKSELRFADISSVDYSQALWAFAIGDPADRGGDFYAMPYCYVMPGFDVVVRDVIFNKDGIDANTPRIAEKAALHGMEQVIVEANGGWVSSVSLLKRQFKEGSGVRVSAYANSIDKMVRILSNFEFIKKHFVFDDKHSENREYASFIGNLTRFKREGQNENDDAADVLAAAASFIKVKYGKLIYA